MRKNDDQLKLGIIGAGVMGRNHARVASLQPAIELAGIYDPNATIGTNTASNYHVRYFSEVDSLLDVVDAVVIASPTSTHHELALKAISHGKHCLIEKPITVTIAEAEELIALADKNDVTLQVGHIERYNPVFLELKKILMVEDVLTVKASRLSFNISRANDVDVVLDLMIHDIDTINQILGGDIEVVGAVGGRFLSPTVDHVSALFRNKAGMVAELTASKVSQTKIREMLISCVDCFIKVNYLTKEIEITRHATGKYIVERDMVSYSHEALIERVMVPNIEPLAAEHQDFAASIREKRLPLVSGHDGLAALKVASMVQTLCRN